MNKISEKYEKNLVEPVDIFHEDQHKLVTNSEQDKNKIWDGIFIGINTGWDLKAKIYARVKVENRVVNAEIGYEDRKFLQKYVPIGSKLSLKFYKDTWHLVDLKKSKSEFHRNIVISTLRTDDQQKRS